MSDAAKTPGLDADGPDPQLARSRVLAAAQAVRTARTEMLGRLGVTAMEVQLWRDERGPRANGINVASGR